MISKTKGLWRISVHRPIPYTVYVGDFEAQTIRSALEFALGKKAHTAEIDLEHDLSRGEVFGQVEGQKKIIATFTGRKLKGGPDGEVSGVAIGDADLWGDSGVPK